MAIVEATFLRPDGFGLLLASRLDNLVEQVLWTTRVDAGQAQSRQAAVRQLDEAAFGEHWQPILADMRGRKQRVHRLTQRAGTLLFAVEKPDTGSVPELSRYQKQRRFPFDAAIFRVNAFCAGRFLQGQRAAIAVILDRKRGKESLIER